MKKNLKKELSPNHNGPKGRRNTLEQVKLRVTLLNKFIENGVPDGFTAHTSLKALLAYSDSGKIQSRSYPAIYNKKKILVKEIDPSFTGSASSVVDCKDYLLIKIEELRNKIETTSTPSEQVTEAENECNNDDKPKVKTKGELRSALKEQAELIESLAREILRQRSANNTLISLIKERDKYASRTLKSYYEDHQTELCKVRTVIKPALRETISNLKKISHEFDDVFAESEENIVSIFGQ
ncbi:hypothetical protein C4G53_RS02505 [Vibrio parahaemolyticus]|uniref:hypothetical protein n=1 Tax=Vibrio vulnificus TaxID=672 RepID=UPI001A1EA6D0|nr:hypothetical protein [Vibrio vulnificus]EJG1082633.1 hypothetical protein [Vibrio parahaemolyticus]EGQ8172581.1 hypothetical protein [Vibrio vulnificus]EHD0091122.1 hypothetical protein [Vibrio vulnificus]EHV9838350.1 hypothetical protein [Vibrio vulnificus]EHW0634170.1 hypothetical protein [Vibrio vulnificus]